MSLVPWLILSGAAIVLVIPPIFVFDRQHKKVGPNEALIISGRKKPSPSATAHVARSAIASARAGRRS
jgi:uncharacterized membrane protein YqiK